MLAKVSPAKAEKLIRLRVALEHRSRRARYSEIGEYMGVTEGRAHQIVAEAVTYAIEDLKEQATDVLMQELGALDELSRRAWAQMDKEGGFSPEAVRSIAFAMERRAKYLGLDAPIDMRVGLFNVPRGVPASSEVDLDSLTVPELEELERAEIVRGKILMRARKLDPSLEVAAPSPP